MAAGRRKSLIEKIADFFFPPKCPFCQRLLDSGEELMCTECMKTLPYAQAKPKDIPFVSKAAAPLYYEGKARSALLRYKFGGKSAYSRAFAELIAEEIKQTMYGSYDVITWVPLSRARLRKRGYSQTYLLASGAARILGDRTERLLIKQKNIRAQSSLKDDAQRRANTLGAYAVAPGVNVSGMRILLIDDVLTTGATMSECAKTLLLNGAQEVMCVALCRRKRSK